LCRLVGGDRGAFAGLAGVGLADAADDPHLHRDDLQLLADFFTDDLFADAAFAGQIVRGQFMDDFHARQVGRQRFALATTFDGGNDFFGFSFIEHGQLRRFGFETLDL